MTMVVGLDNADRLGCADYIVAERRTRYGSNEREARKKDHGSVVFVHHSERSVASIARLMLLLNSQE